MTVLIRDLRLSPDEEEALLLPKAAKRLQLPPDALRNLRIRRSSLDARKKNDIHFQYTVTLDAPGEKKLLSKNLPGVEAAPALNAAPPKPGTQPLLGRPVVVGAGPAGMFAALTLAREGYRPLILERGAPVEERAGRVETFWNGGPLDPQCNVLFGEGGAGTFSDGKLTTRIKDPRCQLVLDDLVRFGAPPECAYAAKPHIGTDILRTIVARVRKEVQSLGGEYCFHTRLTGLQLKNGTLCAVETNHGPIETNACILAVGHSARDVYQMLLEKGLNLRAKPFAAGVRVEHPQSMIDLSQYGKLAGHPRLGAAEYHLAAKDGARGVYTFCMCPGGQVVASSSEEGGVVTNGMSFHARDGQNANAAVVVQVGPEDFGGGPLDGMRFQQAMERAAFAAGGKNYFAPAQRVGDFLRGQPSRAFSAVQPSYRPGVTPCDLNTVLPGFIAHGLAAALPRFGQMLRGYDMEYAVLTGVETRTSSPVRIEREETGMAAGALGLYPAGEGAGYAGGIVSAAVDGLNSARKLVERFAPPAV